MFFLPFGQGKYNLLTIIYINVIYKKLKLFIMARFKNVQEAIDNDTSYDNSARIGVEIALKGFLNMFGACVSVQYITTKNNYHGYYVDEIKKQVVSSAKKLLHEGPYLGFDHSKIESTFMELVEEVAHEAKTNPMSFALRF